MATFAANFRKLSGSRGEYQMVRFGSGAGPEVVERVQKPEAGLRHQRPPVVAHAADGLRHPGRIAGEQVVILGRAQEAHDPQLDDKVVDDLLRLRLGQRAFREVALEVDVEERRGAAQRHRRAVLFLHGGEVGEVEPLHRFARGARRPGDVEAVALRHRLQFVQRADLLAQFLAVANDVLRGHGGVERRLLLLLLLDEPRHAVERDPPVIADDAPAAIGIGQAGEDVRAAAGADVGGVGVEDAFVVRLAILGERLDDRRVRLRSRRP